MLLSRGLARLFRIAIPALQVSPRRTILAFVIRSFRDRNTEQLFRRRTSVRFQSVARVAMRKLDGLNVAVDLWRDLGLPGNRLEALKGDRQGQHSIRINDRWRICFRWEKGDVYDVEITDYH